MLNSDEEPRDRTGQSVRSQPMPAWWRGYLLASRLRRVFHNPEVMLAPFVLPGMTVTDIGCGLGYFTIPMARMVGDSGKVLAVELQEKRLKVLMERAAQAGVASRICPVPGEAGAGAEMVTADFVLAFYVVHEMAESLGAFQYIRRSLNPGGHLLIVEPSFEVSRRRFANTTALAETFGFKKISEPRFSLSRSALFVLEQVVP